MKIRFNQETKEWEEIIKGDEPTKFDITIDGYLYEYLLHVKKDLQKDKDHPVMVSGDVGSGKSNIARIMCRVVADEQFHPRTHMIRDIEDVKDVIHNAKKGEGIIFDEGSGIFSATDTMTKKSKYARYVLDVCRQKNLFIVIVSPAVHRLSSALVIDRAIVLIRTYYDKKSGARGPFAFYGKKLKEKLYYFAKKNYGSIKGCKVKFRGRVGLDKTFTNEYKKVKDETLDLALDSFDSKKKEKEKPVVRQEVVRQYREDLISKNMDRPVKEMALLLHVANSTIERYRKAVRERLKEVKPMQN